MYIHKEGKGTILGCLAISLSLIGISINLLATVSMNLLLTVVMYTVIGFFILLNLFILYFFRMPKRIFTYNDNQLICPCDGKIVIIEEAEEPEYFQGKRLQVSVFMSPLNVHVNRYPINGKVKFYKYHPGKYLVAWHPKSSTLNERTTIVLEHATGKEVLVRQIAGAVARRIVCYSKEGETVKQNQELGFIKFGSRVDLFLPLDAKVLVNLEEVAKGGQTVIAEW
ncbi:MAG: phosphatidylserine decarboxylase family protein [Bacteroidales bacterium]|jgi:phosphatidylserine decarboxylase|nr:phosphatidylserine decarboxylase family protein [Bacteroidales bacterium]